MSFGSTPVSTTSLGANQFPASAVYTENHAGGNFTAVRGGRNHTDGSSNESAAAEVFTADLAGTGASLSAATTFSGVPSVSQLVVNSYVTLTSPGGMATFQVELQTSAFVGTISFYGLEADGAKLQLISAHQRGGTTVASSTALSVTVATNQDWTGSLAGFSAFYAVCTAFTSGSVTVTPYFSQAPYYVLETNSAGIKADLDTIVTQTTGLATAANQSTGNTLLASIATNTSNTATNTSTIAGAVSSNKMATKAASGDFADGAITTIGANADAAVTGDNTGTLSAKLRGLTKILADIWDSTNHLFAMNVKQIGGQTPTLDNTTILATSMRVKTSVAGDTALTVGQATMANSLPVSLASDQTPKTAGTATRSNVSAAASDTSLLASNSSRKGAIFYNDSTAILYLAYGSSAASTTSYSVQMPGNSYFELPGEPVFTGAIRGIWSAANGAVRITELT